MKIAYTANPRITGFHGTYPQHVASISEINFLESKNHKVWFGDGVYFFIDGIGREHPSEYAKQFAIDQCYNRNTKQYDQKEYSVIEAIIKLNPKKILDLTENKGALLFNEFRDVYIKRISDAGKVPATGNYPDVDILKVMRDVLGIEFVKSNIYIKFAAQRVFGIESKIPNVTVLVVNNPNNNVIKSSIKELKKGVIP